MFHQKFYKLKCHVYYLSVNRDSKLIMKSSNLKSYTFHDLSTATRKFHPGAVRGNDDYYTYYHGYVYENPFAVVKWGTGPITTIKRLKDNPNFKELWLVSLTFQLLPGVIFLF